MDIKATDYRPGPLSGPVDIYRSVSRCVKPARARYLPDTDAPIFDGVFTPRLKRIDNTLLYPAHAYADDAAANESYRKTQNLNPGLTADAANAYMSLVLTIRPFIANRNPVLEST